ncbi:MAG: type II toxin-antitoxin system RelE/ParE family toxin [Oscillospiraceae bacterium]|jgi:addiction module RelE/StbE family toxin|nr:type II toxin-antitoxin system RelE/ParE family toxin [Oscillospiraceae bacterium]
MKYRVDFLPKAERDMEDIEEYLSQFYPSTARKLFEKMHEKASMLEDLPYMCPAYEIDPDFRRMVIDDYLLFYTVNEEERMVDIHHIFRASRDITSQMLTHGTIK